jgi:hypothetical protein
LCTLDQSDITSKTTSSPFLTADILTTLPKQFYACCGSTSIPHFTLASLAKIVHYLSEKNTQYLYCYYPNKTAYFPKMEYYVSFRSTIASASQVRAWIIFLLLIVENEKKNDPGIFCNCFIFL